MNRVPRPAPSLPALRSPLAALAALLFLGLAPATYARPQDPAPAAELDALARFEEVLRERVLPRPAQASRAEDPPADDEDEAAFLWGRAMAIEGLVEVYRRRREDTYLERALAYAEELLELRDSTAKRRDPVRKAALPAWSARSAYPRAYAPIELAGGEVRRELRAALTALIVASGMELVRQMEGDARLLKAHRRALGTLAKELERALAVFEAEYTHAPAGKEGYYFPPGERDVCLPSADLALLARAHFALARGKENEHLQRAQYLARFLRSRLVKGADGATLRWAPVASPNGRGGKHERTFHAGLLADLVRRSEPKLGVFDEAERAALRETFTRIVAGAAPRVPRILEELRPDGSSETSGPEEALPWLWAAATDTGFRAAALDAAQRLGMQAPAEALPVLAALIELRAAVEPLRK